MQFSLLFSRLKKKRFLTSSYFFKSVQKIKKLFGIKARCGIGAQNQRGVMTKGAAKIAALQKHRARHPSREIQQRHFLKTADYHVYHSFLCEIVNELQE